MSISLHLAIENLLIDVDSPLRIMDSNKVNTDPRNLHRLLPAAPSSSSAGTLYFIQLDESSVNQPQVILLNSVTGYQNYLSVAPILPAPCQQPIIAPILPAPSQQLTIINEPQAMLLANVGKVEASKLPQNNEQNVKIVKNKLISKVPKIKRKQKLCKTRVESSMLLNDYGVIKKLTHSEACKLVLEASAAKEPIFLKKRDFSFVCHIDVADKDKSNWLGLLPLGDSKTANVWLYEASGELYGVTTEELCVGTPLAIGYSKQYFEEHDLPDSMPVACLDKHTSKTPSKSWKCPHCSVTLKSAAAIEIHIKNHATRKFLRIKSRCSYCKRVYSSKYSLNRHIQLKQCVMMKSRTNDEPSTSQTQQKNATGTPINRSLCATPINEELPQLKLTGTQINRSLCLTPINRSLCPTPINRSVCPTPINRSLCPTPINRSLCPTPINRSLCPTPINRSLCPTPINRSVCPTFINRSICPTPINEETRLPSDESLQNYTDGLDISTNLFDPDHMPNLDTSASELTPYSLLPLGYKEGNELGAAAEYARFSRELMDNMDVCNDDEVCKVKQKNDEEYLITCPHCKEAVLKSKHKQHFRQCTSQRFICICGKIYFKVETFHQHWQEKHKNIKQTIDPDVPTYRYIKVEKLNSNDESKQEPLKCEECDSVFKRRGMLVNHMWTKHKKKPTLPVEKRIKHYPCVACPIVYRTAAKRKRHLLAHHPGIEIETGKYSFETERRPVSPAACPNCPREYATQAKLYQHIRAAHPERGNTTSINIIMW